MRNWVNNSICEHIPSSWTSLVPSGSALGTKEAFWKVETDDASVHRHEVVFVWICTGWTKLWLKVSESRFVNWLVILLGGFIVVSAILSHRPWQSVLPVRSFAASELVLELPLKACDQGKFGNNPPRGGTCLAKRCCSELFLEFWDGFEASWSRESKSFGGGRSNLCNTSIASHNWKLSGLEGISELLERSWKIQASNHYSVNKSLQNVWIKKSTLEEEDRSPLRAFNLSLFSPFSVAERELGEPRVLLMQASNSAELWDWIGFLVGRIDQTFLTTLSKESLSFSNFFFLSLAKEGHS